MIHDLGKSEHDGLRFYHSTQKAHNLKLMNEAQGVERWRATVHEFSFHSACIPGLLPQHPSLLPSSSSCSILSLPSFSPGNQHCNTHGRGPNVSWDCQLSGTLVFLAGEYTSRRNRPVWIPMHLAQCLGCNSNSANARRDLG
jgi:hypothetical protein